MRSQLNRILSIPAILLAASCGGQKSSPGPVLNGKAVFSPLIKNNTPTADRRPGARNARETSNPDICATFTIQPYQLSANDENASGVWQPENAGAPITFSSSESTGSLLYTADGAAVTTEVIGCAAGPTDSPTNAYNWGYFVTAQNFTTCVPGAGGSLSDPTSLASALALLQPVLINEPFVCTTSTDEPLAINIPIEIPVTLQSGYVDVSASVDLTDVTVGCKIADVESDGLHFGQTYSQLASTAPSSISTLTWSSASGSVSQFSGEITDNSGSAPADDFYTTGIAPASTSLVYQLVNQTGACAASPLGATGGGNIYYATGQAECLTNYLSSGSPTGSASSGTLTTVADLADAVLIANDPGAQQAWGAAKLRTSASGQYLDVVYAGGAGNQEFTFSAGATPNQVSGGAGTNWNSNITEETGVLPTGYTANGVFPNQSGFYFDHSIGAYNNVLGFWVTALDSSGDANNGQLVMGLFVPGYGDNIGSSWSEIGSGGGNSTYWIPLPSIAEQACLGVGFSGSSCPAVPTDGTCFSNR